MTWCQTHSDAANEHVADDVAQEVIEMSTFTEEMTVTSGFAELVYADPAWLRAEFDAIMTANFGDAPLTPPRPRPSSAGPQRPGRRPAGVHLAGRRLAGVMPVARGRYRQRSPPLAGAPR